MHPSSLLLFFLFAAALASGSADGPSAAQFPDAVWLEELDYSQHRDQLRPKLSVKGTPLTIAGRTYDHGFGGVSRVQLLIRLEGRAQRLLATVGIDDVEDSNGSKEFQVWLDDRPVYSSGPLRKGQAASLDVDLRGAVLMELVVGHGGIESDWDRFALGDAQIVLAPGDAADRTRWPRPFSLVAEPTRPIASHRAAPLSINSPRVIGGTPGKPFQHRLAISGPGPIDIEVAGLPDSIRYDAPARALRGTLPYAGHFPVRVQARNPQGVVTKVLTLVGSHAPGAKALTPVMGWNSWNLWGRHLDAAKVRAAADALLSTGLADHGYTYVNIDDGWEGVRDATGRLQPHAGFGDIAALAAELHGRGLKLGIYSSPGPQTCAGFEGSHRHEITDAQTFAAWGVDLLKYDWCTYGQIAPNLSPAEQRRPFAVMQAALNEAPRDIVYSVCNYGRGEVWTWGRSVGGNLWRTTSDIGDSWSSVEGIAFAQSDKAPFAGPGHVNDPDMLVVGTVGFGEQLRPTNLSGNEQILHITHWAMVAAPLLLGCDLTQLDDFTRDLLTNNEVLAVNQDELVLPAERRAAEGRREVWSRPLADGSTAVALYNRGQAAAAVTMRLADLGLTGPRMVRDLWQCRDVGVVAAEYSAVVPQHGAILLKVSAPPAPAAR